MSDWRLTTMSVIASLWLLGLAFAIGGYVGDAMSDSDWKQTLLKRGLAEYDPKTGVLNWIEDTEAEETE